MNKRQEKRKIPSYLRVIQGGAQARDGVRADRPGDAAFVPQVVEGSGPFSLERLLSDLFWKWFKGRLEEKHR